MSNGGLLAVFHLDYFSCVLTILSTILIGRKRWTGFIVAAINSMLVCWIGVQTHQMGFIPANLFCLAIYAWNIQAWLSEANATRRAASSEPVKGIHLVHAEPAPFHLEPRLEGDHSRWTASARHRQILSSSRMSRERSAVRP